MFLFSCFLVILMVPLRLACASQTEDVISIIVVLLTGMKFLFFCRGLKMVGTFVLMVYKIVAGDLLRFFLIYGVFVIGFSQSFYVIFLGYKRHEHGEGEDQIHEHKTIMKPIRESLLRMFIMSLNEFGQFYEDLNYCELAAVGKVMLVVYICLVSILLMNLLIAMMTNTYTVIKESKNEWLRQESELEEMKQEKKESCRDFEEKKLQMELKKFHKAGPFGVFDSGSKNASVFSPVTPLPSGATLAPPGGMSRRSSGASIATLEKAESILNLMKI